MIASTIYKHLKDAIITGKIRPRELIYEKEIAAKFNSSKTPVREAIKKLATEGFLEITPYRPAVVAEVSLEKFLKISETLYILDSHASQVALKELTEEDLNKLNEMNKKLEEYSTVETLEQYLDMNAQIHIFIWQSIDNEYLYSIIQQVFDSLIQGHRHILYSQWTLHKSYLKTSLAMHNKLTEALVTRNSRALKRAVRSHWRIYSKLRGEG